jgi:dihydropteroate synthase
MGIVNVTPDSFSDGGRFTSQQAAVAHARRLVSEGATFIDIGGESTRPGAVPVSVDEELGRILPVVDQLRHDDVVISIDTYKSAVAEVALRHGAHLINDISGLSDPNMASVCAGHGAPMVLMHMRGTPQTMQNNPRYEDVVREVADHLQHRAGLAISAGVPSVFVDPGIGFGKTLQHNLSLLRAMPIAGSYPTLVGASRKRSIGDLSGEGRADRRDPGSIAIHLDAARRGVAMVRVHDVAGHVQALRVQSALLGEMPNDT